MAETTGIAAAVASGAAAGGEGAPRSGEKGAETARTRERLQKQAPQARMEASRLETMHVDHLAGTVQADAMMDQQESRSLMQVESRQLEVSDECRTRTVHRATCMKRWSFWAGGWQQ
mmetsp:Transcript_108187/g.349281  ORF Transcript_108187/g.349281 Transcript_108187/m.349281 type:complete len:117 (-) Transcript_108187:318-668(-)